MEKMKNETYYWAAMLDGEIDTPRATRAEAERDARWLRNHPACRDRIRFGHGGSVRVVRMQECEWTGELVELSC